jgi:pyruvate-formate lyase-activating enzyme
MSKKNRIIEIQDITNKISPTFCLAKWHHTTIYLQTGETHSCYHPAPHHIPLEEIGDNPGALHNTLEKKTQRLAMLEGEKPSGCQYCWNIEAMGPDYISDRHERNEGIYTPERVEEITTNDWMHNINPEYVEISFGNECNFKCGYCHPKASSSFYKEVKNHGPYDMVMNHRIDITHLKLFEEETNPYVKAWWDWWPTMRKDLSILRVTGGEPLLQQSTWKLLDDLEVNPLPRLELNINTNLGIKPVLVTRLAKKIINLQRHKGIKNFKLFSSIDTWGPRAEYIRTGLKLTDWEENFHTYIRLTHNPITLMITFNLLSVTSFKSLLEKILEWRDMYPWMDDHREHRIRFDTPYLKEPLQYDMNILPKEEFMTYMYESLEFMKQNVDNNNSKKFNDLEYEKFRRVVDYMETTVYSDEKLLEGRKDFYNWFNEYDRRRNCNLLETFPELTNFYEQCRDLNNGS